MKNKTVFLDRDDTLIEDPGYINHPNQVKLLPGVSYALGQLKKMGFLLVIVTNQSAVARGIISEETLKQIHHRIKKLLADEGAYVDAIYYCPFHPEGVIPHYTKESELRKPNPGMLLKASQEMNIDLSMSWMLGDSYRDVMAGQKAGCRTILIDSHVKPAVKNPNEPDPDYKVYNIREAVNIIRRYELRSSDAKLVQSSEQRPEDAPETAPDFPLRTNEPLQTESQAEPSLEPQSEPEFEAEKQEPVEPALPESKSQPQVPQENPPVTEPATVPIKTEEPSFARLEHLLYDMISHFKTVHRTGQYEDFKLTNVLAGASMAMSVGCLIVGVIFWMDSTRNRDSVLIMLGFAAVLQLMAIAFYMTRNKG